MASLFALLRRYSMLRVEIYVNHKFFRFAEFIVLPNVKDRLVFENNAFVGYIVDFRQFKGKEIKLFCKQDR